jgi:hypothetical protein
MELTSAESPLFDRHGLTWHKLSGRDRCNVIRGIKARERSQLEGNLKSAGVDDAGARFAELEAFDQREYGQAEFIGRVNTPEGQDEVQALSLRRAMLKAGAKADEVDSKVDAALADLTISQAEANKLTADLCGLEIVQRTAPATEGDGPNEQPGAPAMGKPAPLSGYGT